MGIDDRIEIWRRQPVGGRRSWDGTSLLRENLIAGNRALVKYNTPPTAERGVSVCFEILRLLLYSPQNL